SGQNGPDAVFESARCLHNQFLHEAAVGGFTTFLTEYPEHQRSAEALLLTGESLMAIGRMNEGLEYLRRVPLSEVRLFEEAQFVIGEGLRRLDQPDAERAHFAKFIASRPRSFRLAEAVLHQGRAAARAGESEAARSLYWKTLEELGED